MSKIIYSRYETAPRRNTLNSIPISFHTEWIQYENSQINFQNRALSYRISAISKSVFRIFSMSMSPFLT